MPLDEYKRKRDFRKTSEPAGAAVAHEGAAAPKGKGGRYVVQRHRATRLHYDFRLEIDGVLVSWAVPRGPTLDPAARRMAIHVEDHPIEYLDFEGVIPKGEYGGGTVMVWDIGTYEVVDGNYYKGSLQLHLEGSKLKGEWLLRRDRAKGDRNWLMTKVAPAVKRPS